MTITVTYILNNTIITPDCQVISENFGALAVEKTQTGAKNPVCALSVDFFSVRPSQQVIGRNAVIISKGNKNVCRDIVSSRFVVAVCPLAYVEYLRHVRLGKVAVLSQVTYSFVHALRSFLYIL